MISWSKVLFILIRLPIAIDRVTRPLNTANRRRTSPDNPETAAFALADIQSDHRHRLSIEPISLIGHNVDGVRRDLYRNQPAEFDVHQARLRRQKRTSERKAAVDSRRDERIVTTQGRDAAVEPIDRR